jgi:hypothetical protein
MDSGYERETPPTGTPERFPADTLPASFKERFKGGVSLDEDWEGICAGDYTFAPGASTFWG